MENNWKVLLIDDDPGIRKILSIALRAAGYAVITASDGETGIKLCQTESPQIVITDIGMPGIDGLEVLKRIKEMDQEKEVIVSTAFTEIALAVKAMQLDATGFITKPVSDEALTQALERAKERYKRGRDLEHYTTLMEEKWMDTTGHRNRVHFPPARKEQRGSCKQQRKYSVKYLTQEELAPLMLRIGEKFLGAILFEDLTEIHEQYAVRNAFGKAHLVRYHEHGHTFSSQVDHDIKDFLYHFRIQCTSRLVKQHYLRLHAKAASYGDPLLLTAGQLPGILARLFSYMHFFQIVHSCLFGFGFGCLSHPYGSQG